MLADFVNRTGDPVFDETLRQGLATELEQSPFLRLLSENPCGTRFARWTARRRNA